MVKIEELNRKRNSAKKKFDDEVKNFEIVLEACPEISRLEEAFNEIKGKYKAIREVHGQITELMVEAEIEITDFTNHDSFVTGIIGKCGDLLAKLEHYRKNCEMDKGLMKHRLNGDRNRSPILRESKYRNFLATLRIIEHGKEYSRAL